MWTPISHSIALTEAVALQVCKLVCGKSRYAVRSFSQTGIPALYTILASLHRTQRVPNASNKTLKRMFVTFTRKGAGGKLRAGGRKAVGLFKWFKYSLNQRRNDQDLAAYSIAHGDHADAVDDDDDNDDDDDDDDAPATPAPLAAGRHAATYEIECIRLRQKIDSQRNTINNLEAGDC
eukprot:6177229-Pleurochrysis_carterae.AAC.1